MIRFYWKAFPVRFRKQCLFRETCSHYVYRRAQEQGFSGGLNALVLRFRQCRPGYYSFTLPGGETCLCLADKTILRQEEIALHLLPG